MRALGEVRGAGALRMKRLLQSKHNWLGVVAILLLLLLTLYYLRSIDPAEWRAATAYWRDHLWLFAVALGINYFGIACDFGAWSLMYGKFGVRLPVRVRLPLFLAIFAGQFMPLQSARLIRPMLVRRLQPTAFARSAGAEAALFYVDLVALSSVILFLALLILAPWIAIPGGLCLAGAGFLVAHFLFRRIGMVRRATDRDFWFSGAAVGAAFFRAADWLLQGLILFLLLRPLVDEAAFAAAALSALVSTTVGAGTGLPGGVGATEGIMTWLVGLTAISAAHRMITVGAYRLITFYLQLPLGWLCLVLLRARAARRGGAVEDEVLPMRDGSVPHT